MYITINDIIGEKRIDLSYPIKGKDIAVVSMLSDNVQYWLQGHLKVQLKSGKEIMLNKGIYRSGAKFTDRDGAESANDRFP